MKEIRGSTSAVVPAPAQQCFALLAAVDRYGEWNRDLVRELEVLQRDPLQLTAVIHIKQSRFSKTIELRVAVSTEPPHAVRITRIPDEPSDPESLELTWHVAQRDAGSRIQLDVAAVVSLVPRYVPLGRAGKLIAEKLLGSATSALGGDV
jgi:ribosome-associated toxin RatA of RatAB toxin-antitoxin module